MPMQVNKVGQQKSVPLVERERTGPETSGQLNFSSQFGKVQTDQLQEYLNRLIQQINDQGRQLHQVPTWSELKRYRNLVRNFVGEAVKNMYSLQSEHGWDRLARQKVYTTVKKIDGALEELTDEVRSGQKNQLNILAKLDAIRGMLVDLYT